MLSESRNNCIPRFGRLSLSRPKLLLPGTRGGAGSCRRCVGSCSFRLPARETDAYDAASKDQAFYGAVRRARDHRDCISGRLARPLDRSAKDLLCYRDGDGRLVDQWMVLWRTASRPRGDFGTLVSLIRGRWNLRGVRPFFLHFVFLAVC
jgi:hypothetical protein